MAISSVLTKDGVFGTYERTRAGIKAYPNTKKVAAPKYLLASPGGPYYYDPDIDGVSRLQWELCDLWRYMHSCGMPDIA